MLVAVETKCIWPEPGHYEIPQGQPRALLNEDFVRCFTYELSQGVPVRRICLKPGWPDRLTIRNWQSKSIDFDVAVNAARLAGYRHLETVALASVIRALKRNGASSARKMMAALHRELAQAHGFYFGGGAWQQPAREAIAAAVVVSRAEAARLAGHG